MPHSTCGHAHSCARCDVILDLPDLHLTGVERLAPDGRHRRGLIRLTVATDPTADGQIIACHGCGVLAADHGRRTQQTTLGRRGRKNDPLYKIRRLLTTARENLTDRGTARLEAALQAGDPGFEVTIAWHAYQELRSMFHTETPAAGRGIAVKVLDSFHTCPVPEIARLGRTLRSWRAQILAYFDTGGVSNGGTEAINLIIKKVRRLAHGFRNFANYRIRILLAADGTRPWRSRRKKKRSG